MKTIFRYTNVGLLLAVILTLGAVAGFAQTPCEDAELGTSSDAIRQGFTTYATASLEDKKKTINAGKTFLEKYGACEKAKDLTDYLKQYLPGLEESLTKASKDAAEKVLTDKFNNGLKTKNYDDAYAAGRELLTTNPDKFRPALLALGSIGTARRVSLILSSSSDTGLMSADWENSMRCSNCTTSGRLRNATASRSRKVSWYSRSASTAWP